MVVSANVVDKFDKLLVNDILSDIIGIHKGVLNSDEFIEKTKVLCNVKNDQNAYIKLRESYNNEKTPEKLWALILSCNSNLMRFNSLGGLIKRGVKDNGIIVTDKKVKEFINQVRPYKDKIIFSNKHFNDIKIIKPTFCYLDPPYAFCEDINGKITSTQISEAGYNVTYKQETDIQLYEYCKNLDKNSSTFMLSGLLEHDGKKILVIKPISKRWFQM